MNTCQQHTAKFPASKTASRRFVHGLTLTLIAMIVLSLGASMALAANPLPVVNAPLVPEQKAPGAGAFTLTVNGSGFVSGATVYWNGSARTTTFVKSTQVTASITAADVATAGTSTVTVANSGGGMSNAGHFQVVKNGYTVAYSKLDYATDLSPQDVAAADFNGDGKLDLAVPTASNTLSILLGNGTGSFPTHVEYPVPGHPIAVITGDFNGDGKVDLATVDEFTSQITILLGKGDGTFQGHVEYSTGNHPVALATSDVNGDGKLDIVVCDLNDGKVSVLIGNGDGTFKTHVDYATGNGPSGVAIGDFNGDGKLDLVVANNTDNTVAILLGNGDGTFGGPTAFPTSLAPNSIVIGDFNGDAKLDLAVGTSNKQVSVLLGNGNGTFQNHKEYGIGANAVVVAAADLGANGKLSLISANYNDNSVSTLGGNGDGTFKSQSVFPTNSGPIGLAVGDFNGNGKPDIAVVTTNANMVSVLSDSWISLSPGLVSFGTQTSGFKSAAKMVTLKNNGTTAWAMGGVSYVGLDSTDFSTSATTCPNSGSNVAAGASCTISIVFQPTASETADAQILITPSSGGLIGNVLQGSGNIPITLTPRTQTMATTLLFTKSAGKTNTFTNDSGVNIYFTLIDLEGVNQTDFSFTSTCAGGGPPFNYSVPLLPGASCTSTVYFTPTMQPPGNETVTMVYYGNMTLVKQGLLINGVGTAVKVTPTSLTFPTCKVGNTCTGVVTMQNAGTTALAITSANFINGTANVFSIQSNTCNFVQGSGGSVPASSSCTFTLAFSPTVVGTQTATFSIGDPDPTGPQQVKLTGTGN